MKKQHHHTSSFRLKSLLNACAVAALPVTLAIALAAAPSASLAQEQAKPEAAKAQLSPSEITANAKAEEWVDIAPDNLLVMELAPDRDGHKRQVVIQLMQDPVDTAHIGNVKKLARAHWWDDTEIVRVQDNYVTQWGGGDKPVPDNLESYDESSYLLPLTVDLAAQLSYMSGRKTLVQLDDPYAPQTLFLEGWPLGFDGESFWPLHCYGMVGVGRNLSPDTGTGAELYTVIGHAPRHLDRNIAMIGRIISGMEHMSSLKRGTGDLGFYEDEAERTAIVSVRLASELPQGERPHWQYLNTASGSFAAYAHARANRGGAFFNIPAGGVDVCNVQVPLRKKP